MTRPDLDAIEAREHAATPGPWNVDGDEIVAANGARVLRAWAEYLATAARAAKETL